MASSQVSVPDIRTEAGRMLAQNYLNEFTLEELDEMLDTVGCIPNTTPAITRPPDAAAISASSAMLCSRGVNIHLRSHYLIGN